MRHTLSILALLAIAAFISVPAGGQVTPGTLYEQEGTVDDGYTDIDATGAGPQTEPSRSNWIWQSGGTSTWSAVFHGGDVTPWVDEQGEWPPILVEADIEMYIEYEMTDPNIYFHIGNLYTAGSEGKLTAHVMGSLTSNNGQYIGLEFKDEQGVPFKVEEQFHLDTGTITNGMVGVVDNLARDISGESFDIKITLDWGTGQQPPTSYSGTSHPLGMTHVLFWLVGAGVPGTYPLDWEFTLDPATDQPDGNYVLDPTVVVAPAL